VKRILVVFFVLIASTAHAQSLKLPANIFLAAAASDDITTRVALSNANIYEVNPLYRGFVGHPNTQLIAMSAVDGLTAYWFGRVVARQHPKLATVALYTLAGFRSYIAIHNLQAIRDVR
jgi:hypothetical protein